ncbi:MAG: hypothetical protein ACE37F_17410 [Nannocystaceae bacterium]|nr:hypothetical protein [bacterium]
MTSTDEHPFCLISNSSQDPRPEIAGLEGPHARCGEGGVWVRAWDLAEGDLVASVGGVSLIKGLERVASGSMSQDVYNITVRSAQNYSVLSRGVLVHNKPYMTSKGWAADYANQLLKHWKKSGVGTGAASGQHGKPFARAAADIRRTIRAKGAKTKSGEFIELDAEVLEELAKKEVEFLNRAKGYNHAVK